MSIDINVSTNGVSASLSRRRIAQISEAVLRGESVRNALVSITLLTPGAIARLNAEHLGHRGQTDIISFGFSRATRTDPVVGDIYICPGVGRANALSRGEPIRRELARLVIHGTLHILGYEHPENEDREHSPMWRRQERFVARLARGAA